MSTDVDELKREIESLRNELRKVQQEHESSLARANQPSPYFSEVDLQGLSGTGGIPQQGMPAKAARALIEDHHAVDFNQRLNTSSYVNVEFEPEEEAVALMGLRINLADPNRVPAIL